jgi:hypothetical protein
LAFLIAHQDEIAERFIPRWYRPPAGHHRRPGHHRQPPAARGRRDGPPVSGEAIGERGSEGGERIPSAPGAVFTRRRQTGWLWRGRCASRATAKTQHCTARQECAGCPQRHRVSGGHPTLDACPRGPRRRGYPARGGHQATAAPGPGRGNCVGHSDTRNQGHPHRRTGIRLPATGRAARSWQECEQARHLRANASCVTNASSPLTDADPCTLTTARHGAPRREPRGTPTRR